MGLVVVIALAIALTSCSGGDGGGDSTTTTTIAPVDLRAAARATAEEPTVRFRTSVDAVPDPFGASSSRTGAFDREHRRGSAIVATTARVVEPANGERVEFRLLDGTFWQGWPQPRRRWTGTDAASLTAVPGNALVGAADVGVIVHALSDAVVRRRGVADGPDGSMVWAVALDGDQVGRLSTPDTTFTALTDAGFDGTTGVRVDGRVTVDRDGRLVRVEADLSDWWLAALRETQVVAAEPVVVQTVFAFDGFGDPVEVTAPCADPETDLGYRFPVLVCPG